MSIIRWDPWGNLDKFFDEEWGLMPVKRAVGGPERPLVDVYQTDKDVVVEVSIPAGIDPEKVDISIEGDVLTVRGAAEDVREEKEKNYYRKEIRRGAFERSVMLPAAVKADQADASYDKGVLKIVIPKVEEEKAKRVQVRVKK